jgi:uncharacterized protein (TIGR02246 family)
MDCTRRIAILGTVVFLFVAPLTGAPAQSKADDAESAAIKQVVTYFNESFNRHDAHATAMIFAEDADFTNMFGAQRHGRNEIEQRFTALFVGNLKSAQRTDAVRNIRFLTPVVVSVDADSVISGSTAPDGSTLPPRKGLLILVMTKQSARWLISVFHEAEFPPTPGAPASTPATKPPNK